MASKAASKTCLISMGLLMPTVKIQFPTPKWMQLARSAG